MQSTSFLKQIRLPAAFEVPPIDRPLLAAFTPARLGRRLELRVARAADVRPIRDYLWNEFFGNAELLRTLQAGKEDVRQELTAPRLDSIANGRTIVCLDEGRICGVAINRVVRIDGDLRATEVRFPPDLAARMAVQEGNQPAARAARAMSAWMTEVTPRLLPECAVYFHLDMLSVHTAYRGCGIGRNLWSESLRMAARSGIADVVVRCTARASNLLAESLGFAKLFEFSYAELVADGRRLFPDGRAADGGRTIGIWHKRVAQRETNGKSDE
ncbi:hypothetical protein M3Y99_00102600 [Aphelenchoides fujianensis]|nr:hypothetical protein M3Y99_00102600 [Aphelenchoides fujianensis]